MAPSLEQWVVLVLGGQLDLVSMCEVEVVDGDGRATKASSV
jgi:hypothetical protein